MMYQEFLASKHKAQVSSGRLVEDSELNDALYPFQRAIDESKEGTLF